MYGLRHLGIYGVTSSPHRLNTDTRPQNVEQRVPLAQTQTYALHIAGADMSACKQPHTVCKQTRNFSEMELTFQNHITYERDNSGYVRKMN